MLCYINKKDTNWFKGADSKQTRWYHTNRPNYNGQIYGKYPINNTYIRHAAMPLDPSHIDTCQKQYKMRPPTLTMDRPACDTIRTRAFWGVGWRGINKSPTDGEVLHTAHTLQFGQKLPDGALLVPKEGALRWLTVFKREVRGGAVG